MSRAKSSKPAWEWLESDDDFCDDQTESDYETSGSEWSFARDGEEQSSSCSDDGQPDDDGGASSDRTSPSWMAEIANLPHELLASILVHSFQSHPNPLQFSLYASQVSQFWRVVALSTPVLWTVLDIRKSIELSRILLERSGSCPLDLRMSLHPTTDKDEGEVRLCEFSTLLAPYAARIHDVILHVSQGTWISASSPLLGTTLGPINIQLLDLRFLTYSSNYIDEDIDPYELSRGLQCHPTSLIVHRFPVNSSLLSTSLRSLDIHWQPEPFQTNIGKFILHLAHCPNIESLHLAYTTDAIPDQYDPPEHPVELPRLTDITFCHVHPISIDYFFQYINTPSLTSLTVELQDGWPQLDFLVRIARQSPSVEQLTLEGVSILKRSQFNSLVTALGAMSALTTLTCRFCHIPWHLMRGLVVPAPREQLEPLCPRLSSLTIDFDTSITHTLLVNIAISRAHAKNRAVPLKALACRAPVLRTFDRNAVLEKLRGKVPTIVLDDVRPARRTHEPREDDVEEEWLRPGEEPELDSGDEEIVEMGDK